MIFSIKVCTNMECIGTFHYFFGQIVTNQLILIFYNGRLLAD